MLKDDEIQGVGNSYTTEFRQYDARLGRWTAVDPFAHKNSAWTPYHFCKNNSISKIDPDGRDDIYYNSKGEKTKTVDRSWLFELFAGDRSFIKSEGGKNFRLTNQALDVVKSGKFKGFESNWENSSSKTGFKTLLKNATSHKGDENVFSYIFKESGDQGHLDQKKNLDPYKIYGAGNVAMNRNEAGNYVWGAALAKFGISTDNAVTLAHGGTLYLETIARPSNQGRGWGLSDLGYRLSKARFDEPDEIKAIEAGSVKVFGYRIIH